MNEYRFEVAMALLETGRDLMPEHKSHASDISGLADAQIGVLASVIMHSGSRILKDQGLTKEQQEIVEKFFSNLSPHPNEN